VYGNTEVAALTAGSGDLLYARAACLDGMESLWTHCSATTSSSR
jgi:hypothetical protein